MALEQGARLPEELQNVVVSHGEASGNGTDGARLAGPARGGRTGSIQSRRLRKLPPRVIRLYPLTSGRAGGRLFQTNGSDVELTVEHRPMHFLSRPGARALLAVALSRGPRDAGPCPAAARGAAAPTPPPPTTQSPAAPPSGPERPLSINEAVDLALKQNLGIQIERLNPQLQDYTIAQALANYTPIFGGGRQLQQPAAAAEQLPLGQRHDGHEQQLARPAPGSHGSSPQDEAFPGLRAHGHLSDRRCNRNDWGSDRAKRHPAAVDSRSNRTKNAETYKAQVFKNSFIPRKRKYASIASGSIRSSFKKSSAWHPSTRSPGCLSGTSSRSGSRMVRPSLCTNFSIR